MGFDRGRDGDDPTRQVDRSRDQSESPDSPLRRARGDRGGDVARPVTVDVQAEQKVARGELRWIGDEWVESPPFEHVRRRDRADRMRSEVDLGENVRELPNARDVLPNLNRAELDSPKTV